jgi:glycosyltransferase involved in cell wall biosynthesis
VIGLDAGLTLAFAYDVMKKIGPLTDQCYLAFQFVSGVFIKGSIPTQVEGGRSMSSRRRFIGRVIFLRFRKAFKSFVSIFAGDRLLIEYRHSLFRMIAYYITESCLPSVALRYRCQLIHAHWAIPTGLIGVFAGALLGKPLIVTIHGSDLRMAVTQGGFLERIFTYVCQKADRLVCVSEGMRQKLESMKIDMRKTTVLPMGVDESFFDR